MQYILASACAYAGSHTQTNRDTLLSDFPFALHACIRCVCRYKHTMRSTKDENALQCPNREAIPHLRAFGDVFPNITEAIFG